MEDQIIELLVEKITNDEIDNQIAEAIVEDIINLATDLADFVDDDPATIAEEIATYVATVVNES